MSYRVPVSGLPGFWADRVAPPVESRPIPDIAEGVPLNLSKGGSFSLSNGAGL
jgi:hypothetical protein